MMILPDSIYQQFRSYKEGVLPRAWFDSFYTTGGLATVSFKVPAVEDESDLILTNMIIHGNAGATQTTLQLMVMVNPYAPANPNYILWETFYQVLAAQYSYTWNGNLLIPHGNQLEYKGIFSSGVNPNRVDFCWSGYLVPRMDS